MHCIKNKTRLVCIFILFCFVIRKRSIFTCTISERSKIGSGIRVLILIIMQNFTRHWFFLGFKNQNKTEFNNIFIFVCIFLWDRSTTLWTLQPSCSCWYTNFHCAKQQNQKWKLKTKLTNQSAYTVNFYLYHKLYRTR